MIQSTKLLSMFGLVCAFCAGMAFPILAVEGPKPLAKPSPQQYAWQEQERLMFVCLDPCTWQGREYDNHSTPLSQINPTKLDANQFCRAAKLWGAKQLLLVAKHTGGFCWWQTETSEYSVKNTPWRGGKGDLVKEVADACREHGLNLGIYVYPGDDMWGAPKGSGGRTKDPARQEGYNKVFRQQLTEVLTRYGKMTEVWFDGSCVIAVGDLLKQYAPDAVVFQGPQATIRWPGTESGKLRYPVWSSLKSSDLKTGLATMRHDDPDGDAWAPHEADTTLYNHFWFWSAAKESKRKSLTELMDIYIKSVGRGGVLLLNSTPNTDGLIPEGDMALYEAFGKKIDRCFGHPLGETKGSGSSLEIDLDKPMGVDSCMLMEDYREGHRIREYVIEGWDGKAWVGLAEGSSVGRMKIDAFPERTVSKVRLQVTKAAAEPLIRKLAVFRNGLASSNSQLDGKRSWQSCGKWAMGTRTLRLELNRFISKPGQYEVRLKATNGKLTVAKATLLYEGAEATPGLLRKIGDDLFHINRTGQVTDETSSVLMIELAGAETAGEVWIQSASAE